MGEKNQIKKMKVCGIVQRRPFNGFPEESFENVHTS